VSAVRKFPFGSMKFEAVICTDPSTGDQSAWVYRVDIAPRAVVATGVPESLNLTPGYAHLEAPMVEQAVADSFEDAPA
jgi:hypothetical protein